MANFTFAKSPKRGAPGSTDAQDNTGKIDYDALIGRANDRSTSAEDANAIKYMIATDLARNSMGDKNYDDSDLEAEIDRQFDMLDPTTTGAEMRGENAFTQGVEAASDFIDDANATVGTGIDWVWDNTVGNLAGLAGNAIGGLGGFVMGEDVADSARKTGEAWKDATSDLVTPENAAIVSDMAIDLGLSAIPGAGIPLVLAKNAIQQSENIAEAASGYDSVTGEKLDENQRIGRGLGALATLGLSAIPGVGVARNAAKVGKAADEIAEGAAKNIDELTAQADELDDIIRTSTRMEPVQRGEKAIADNGFRKNADEIRRGIQELRDASGNNPIPRARNLVSDLPEMGSNYIEGIKQAAGNLVDGSGKLGGRIGDMGRALVADPSALRSRITRRELMDQAQREVGGERLAKRIGKLEDRAYKKGSDGKPVLDDSGERVPAEGFKANRALQALRGMESGSPEAKVGPLQQAGRAIGAFGTNLGALTFGNMAETGDSLIDAAANTLGGIPENVGAYGALMLPIGAGRLSRNLPGLSGASQRYIPSNVPLNAARGAAALRFGQTQAEDDLQGSLLGQSDPYDLDAYLRGILDRGSTEDEEEEE